MNKTIHSQRIEQQFFRLLLATLLKSSDPFWSNFNVSRIKMSNDLQQCRIFFTTIKKNSQEEIAIKIKHKSFALTKILISKWTLARFPKLIFVYDQALIDAENLDKILKSDN